MTFWVPMGTVIGVGPANPARMSRAHVNERDGKKSAFLIRRV
jgi:hypothetical protein